MMMQWQELVKAALMGTNRGQLSSILKETFSNFEITNTEESAQQVLDAAAMLSLMQKTGVPVETWDKALPEVAPPDTTEVCSSQSSRHLSLILQGTYDNALPEFIAAMLEYAKRLPPERLPDLLDRALADQELWQNIKSAIGQRGQWLIRQNPHWQELLVEPDPAAWDTASLTTRINILKYLRQHQPEAAVALITQTWDEDDLQSRTKFLKTLETNLSAADEAFIENCLNNSRSEIRKVAVKLLNKIPDSALNKRIFSYLIQIVAIKKRTTKKPKLEITLPENLTDAQIRDGINPKTKWYQGGIKAGQLGQMVAYIPPQWWNQHFDVSTTVFLELIVRSDWSELILQAVADAAATHQDEIWAEALLNFWLENYHKQRWNYFNPKRLLEEISPSVFNKIAIYNIKHTNSLLDEDSPLTTLLRSVQYPWTDELSLLILSTIRDWIDNDQTSYWSGWHLRSILKQGAYLCSPELLNQFNTFLIDSHGGRSGWNKEIDNFFITLRFRKEMWEAMAE